jgi:DnaJ-class molecular chaperone
MAHVNHVIRALSGVVFVTCYRCAGTGTQPDGKTLCSKCHGTGTAPSTN